MLVDAATLQRKTRTVSLNVDVGSKAHHRHGRLAHMVRATNHPQAPLFCRYNDTFLVEDRPVPC